MHFLIAAEGYETLVTCAAPLPPSFALPPSWLIRGCRSLYIRGDPYETSDAVFGVKSSLVVDVGKVDDPAVARKYGVAPADWAINYDFVLVSEQEARDLRLKNAHEALQALGSTAQVLNGLPSRYATASYYIWMHFFFA